MKLIAGLGNPGKEYEKTRHNCGFMVMDQLAEKCSTVNFSAKWNALIAKVQINGQQVLLMKPLTYMNNSGSAVAQAVSYYKIAPQDILVIHDDMDLPVGSVRIRTKGSAGGQKGMKSIIQALGTQDIARIRVGVGHSDRGNHDLVPDWVLSPVSKEERSLLEDAVKSAADAAYAWVWEPLDKVMSQYNIKVKKQAEDDGRTGKD